MGQATLAKGLIWRRKPAKTATAKRSGTYHKNIYYQTTYRGHRLRGSTGTSDPVEAERRLRLKKQRIDEAEIYGLRPDWLFGAAINKFIEVVDGKPTHPESVKYLSHLQSMAPFVKNQVMRKMNKESFLPWIEYRYEEGVSARTVSWGLEAARRIFRLAAYYWKDEFGMSWIDNAPIISMEKGPKLEPYPLSWEQQDMLFAQLSEKMHDMCLYKVNSGCRSQEVIKLKWEWEMDAGIGETVFKVPGSLTKNKKPHFVVLNSVARMVIEKWRGEHEIFVFGEPMLQMTNAVWQKAWQSVIGDSVGFRKGIHNLKHTFGKRLRDAGVDERDVQDLLHHMPKTVTRDYSQPELKKLRACVELIVRRPQLRAVG